LTRLNLQLFSAVIIGQGAGLEEIRRFIISNGLESKVKLMGYLTRDKLAEHYRSFDVFVFPSTRESLGLVGLEALACGTPVIGSDIPAIKEYIRDGFNGFLFEKGNPDDLAGKLNGYLKLGADKRLKLSRNAVETVQHRYSKKQVGEQLSALFSGL
jgi:glycosyltransferase involved in cell wall biosynthesis